MADTAATPRTIRLGVIGTGLAVEQLHWPALVRLPARYRITAFANHTRPKAEHFARYTGAAMEDYHADYHDLLARADVDAVLISLPINLLLAAARDALAAGKHVICEKPAGGDEAEGRAFLALAAAHPERTVLIAENYFYRDDLRLAQSLLADGVIGRLHLMAWRLASQNVPVPGKFSGTPWRHRPQYRGGAHLDGGVHQMAQIRMLCGDVARVHGVTQRANATIDAPSDLALTLTFTSGAVGAYTACYPDIPLPAEPNDMRLYGTGGVMILDGEPGNRRVAVHRADGTAEEHRFTGIDNGYYGEFLNFSDAVVHGEPVIGTVAQSVANMRVILRGLDAAESGQAVALDDAAGTAGVPLWKPRGAQGLFDGLPGAHTVRRG